MKTQSKKLSPALFGLTLICFCMPFVTISCQEQKIMEFNGVQLATGTTIKQPTFNGPAKEEKIAGNPLAGLAIVAGVVGLGTSFIKAKKAAVAPAGSGAAGSILLLMLKSTLDNEIVKQGQGLLLVNYGFGFWLAFLLFVASTIVNVYSVVQPSNDKS